MKNVQITIDEETLSRVDEAGKQLGLNRSEIVRRALREWLHRHAVERFERDWIDALQRHPDDADHADGLARYSIVEQEVNRGDASITFTP
jgi:Arc/MetJ-type ribon-helix-helix transcriptional regulator